MTQFPMTPKMQEVLQFIRAYTEESGGCCPSIREISAGLGKKSPSSTHATLTKLKERGHIEWSAHHNRSIRILTPEEAKVIMAAKAERYVTHKRRGGVYRVIGIASVQSDNPVFEGDSLCIYQGDDGRIWARPQHEFEDGRFVKAPSINKEKAA